MQTKQQWLLSSELVSRFWPCIAGSPLLSKQILTCSCFILPQQTQRKRKRYIRCQCTLDISSLPDLEKWNPDFREDSIKKISWKGEPWVDFFSHPNHWRPFSSAVILRLKFLNYCTSETIKCWHPVTAEVLAIIGFCKQHHSYSPYL